MTGEVARTTRVGGFSSRTQAVIAQGYLADQGIPSTVVTDDAGGAAPFVAFGSNGVALLMAVEDAERARALLAELRDDQHVPTAAPARPWMARVGRVLVAIVVVGILAGLVAQALGR